MKFVEKKKFIQLDIMNNTFTFVSFEASNLQ